MKERLQKLMAQAGLGSRRHNETVIQAGRVRVNGKVAHLGDKADPAVDSVAVDGVPLKLGDAAVYIVVNKPKNVLSSLEDEMGEDRLTVRGLIDLPGHLYPVGRLDRESEGLILMTNDGDLAHKLTHPRYGHEKVYRVAVEGRPAAGLLDQWRHGVLLDGRPTLPVKIEVVQQQKAYAVLRLTMREGRKRQIRRIAAMLGHPVRQLVREQIGPLQLGDLKPGMWRHLTPREVKALREATKGKAVRRPGERPSQRPSGRLTSGRSPAPASERAPASKRPPASKRRGAGRSDRARNHSKSSGAKGKQKRRRA
jgi:23S rRNA pseudouridine2605 synthase